MTWSDSLGLIGGYRTPELIMLPKPATVSCGAHADTLKVTIKDSHGQSASASEAITLKFC
jgi:hypothetical protein